MAAITRDDGITEFSTLLRKLREQRDAIPIGQSTDKLQGRISRLQFVYDAQVKCYHDHPECKR